MSFLISFWFFFFAGLYAKGGANYSEANKLIKQKKQDTAIYKIIEILEENPESFNLATDALKKAMKNQDKFVKEFLKIINQLYKDPDNSTRILALVNNIEKSNSAMDPQMQDFLQKLKVSSLYARNRIKFNNIMKDGIALIKNGLYFEASNKFMEGYSICYDDYCETYKETERLEKTQQALKTIKETTNLLKKEDVKFLSAINAYKAMFRQNMLKVDQNIVSNLEQEILSVHELGGNIFTNGTLLNSYLAEEERLETFNLDSFLPYSTRLTMGRGNATEYEGVQGSVDAALFTRLSNLEDYILSYMKKILESFFSKFRFGISFEGQIVENLKKHIEEYNRIILLIEKLNIENTRFPKNQQENKAVVASVSLFESILEDTFLVYDKYISINATNYNSREYGDERNVLQIKEISLSLSKLPAIQKKLYEYNFETMSESKDELTKVQINLFSALSNLYQDRLANYARVKNIDGKSAYKEHEKQFFATKKLVDGTMIREETESEVVLYPTKALEQFEKQFDGIRADIEMLQDSIAFISNSSQEIDKERTTNTHFEGIKDSEKKLKELLNNIASLSTRARNDIFKIRLAKQEAEFRYSEALKMFNNGNFSQARDNITRSQQKSTEALDLEDDVKYRALVDERLSKLGLEINQKENEEVVKEVRKSIDNAKKLYFNGNFGEAESILISANTRWHATNIEENEELKNWINITQTASVMKTGRTIPISATLYPQMSQLLSNSKQLYNEASAKIKRSRSEALQKLNEARNNLKQVLLVYPLNEEAGQLGLRIDQLIDPENFQTQVKKKIDKIRSDYKRNPQTYYAELLNLYIMDKTFPGIAKLKDEVEIYLGVKILPPDMTAVNKSKSYTDEADEIYKKGDKSRYNEALQKLNLAIKLNQNNERASLLKDRIQMAMGGTAIAVLSYANEEKYRQAILALQKGNKITAIALVEELLKDTEGRKSAKVHDLKKRINAQL